MSIPRSVHNCVEASRPAPGFFVNEDAGRLAIGGALARDALDAWQAVVDEGAAWLDILCIDSSGDEVQPREVPDGEHVRLTVVYAAVAGAEYVFTPEGWRFLLLDPDRACRSTMMRLAFVDAAETFMTRGCAMEAWTAAPEAAASPEQRSEPGPRRVVRSQSPTLMAPPRIEPYVSVPADVGGPAAAAWREAAAVVIALSLPNELYRDGEEAMVMLAGQPPRKLVMGEAQPATDAFRTEQEAAAWVYLDGSDVEVRHTFLSAELSREWGAGETFREGLSKRLGPALDSARLLYKAHLRSGSKDTLKALSDLRKTLADEVQKLLQQTRDLSAAVWRDVAVAVGAMAIRFAIDSAKSPAASAGFVWVFLAVAAYVAISYATTVSTNRRFLNIVEQSRTAWRTKLYGFLDDADYGTLADQPISDALEAYRRTEFRTTLFVVFVVVLLLAGSAVEARLIDLPASYDWIRGTVMKALSG